MPSLVDILGSIELVRGGDAPDDLKSPAAIPAAEALSNRTCLIYFSAHWCPPCQRFTPTLATLYKKMKSAGAHDFEIVYVSLDRSQGQFDDYTAHMPWLCVPWGEGTQDVRMKLAAQFGAQGIPHLVAVDADGTTVLTDEGVQEVAVDPDGDNFPWRPPTFDELFPDHVLSKAKDADTPGAVRTIGKDELRDKHLMLYFSAHWCPPCRAFTPVLSEAYTQLKAERPDDFELIFVSSDRDQAGFDEYWGEMTFCALPFEERAAKGGLAKRFGVQGIPKLIILGPVPEGGGDRPVINDNLRPVIEGGDFSDFPFVQKPYGDLDASGGEDINDKKCLVVFHENGDDDEQEEVVGVVKAVAEERNDGDDISYYWCTNPKGLGERVRAAIKMTEVGDDPLVVLLDIPDRGGFYVSTESDFGKESLLKFLGAPGERKQM